MTDAKLWGKVSMLRSCIAMQRVFKPEGWTERKHIRFSTEKCQVLPQGQKCPSWQYKEGTDCLACSSARGAWAGMQNTVLPSQRAQPERHGE